MKRSMKKVFAKTCEVYVVTTFVLFFAANLYLVYWMLSRIF